MNESRLMPNQLSIQKSIHLSSVHCISKGTIILFHNKISGSKCDSNKFNTSTQQKRIGFNLAPYKRFLAQSSNTHNQIYVARTLNVSKCIAPRIILNARQQNLGNAYTAKNDLHTSIYNEETDEIAC